MRRFGLVVFAVAAALFLAAPWLDPTRVILGTLSGEAFAAGRPARYWRSMLLGKPAEKAMALTALKTPQAVPVLQELLRPVPGVDTVEVQLTAIDLLGELGADAHDAGGDILAILKSSEKILQPAAAAIVPKLEIPAATAIPVLVPLLEGDAAVPAARAISTYKGEARDTVTTFERLLVDMQRPTDVRWNAARTIGKIGPAAVSAVPTLIDMLDDPEETVREHSSEALGDIGPTAAHAIPHMLPLLQESHPRIRRDTVRSFGFMGPAAKETIPLILPLLDDPEYIVKDAAKTAIMAIDPTALPQAPVPAPSSQANPEQSIVPAPTSGASQPVQSPAVPTP